MAAANGWIGIPEVISAIGRMEKKVDEAGRLTTIQVAAETEARAKANFHGSHKRGRPHVGGEKPNIVSGTLRRSIMFTPPARIAGGYSTTVGPTTEYGRRVELGFKGTDSLGRRYNQPAFPYFGPAVKETRVRAHEIAVTNWAAAIH
jgi:HK97 gp10 family phage protein